MPKFVGQVVAGESIEGEVLATYKEGQWTDRESGETTERLQLQLTVQNPESDYRLISWINLPINEEGDIGDIRTRSGLGCLLKDIKRLTGKDIPEGCEDIAKWVEDTFKGKIVKATKHDSFRYMGLDMSNYLKLDEFATGGGDKPKSKTTKKSKAKAEKAEAEAPASEEDFADEEEFYDYVANLLIEASPSKNDAKGLIRADARIKASEEFGGFARRAARVVETLIEQGLVGYDEGDDVITEPE